VDQRHFSAVVLEWRIGMPGGAAIVGAAEEDWNAQAATALVPAYPDDKPDYRLAPDLPSLRRDSRSQDYRNSVA
jgi:hypothetical protein